MSQKHKPSAKLKEAAQLNPGGWVYEIKGEHAQEEKIPPEAIAGAWQVDKFGQIIGDFIPNPNYQDSEP